MLSEENIHIACPCSVNFMGRSGVAGAVEPGQGFRLSTWLATISGKLPRRCLPSWKAMMAHEDNAKSKLRHLSFEILKFSDVSYQDSVTVRSKGLEMELVKILTVFTSIGFSSNNFHWQIPYEMIELKELYILNLSHNALTGHIPSSIGNLTQLESLDLSSNKLTGIIPSQLGLLNFLSFLKRSYNRLTGKIPTGNHLQTFSSDSFEGNEGLCGPPLAQDFICTDNEEEDLHYQHLKKALIQSLGFSLSGNT